MTYKEREAREEELRAMLRDPVERVILERKFFEATKSIPPQKDTELLEAILDREYGQKSGRT